MEFLCTSFDLSKESPSVGVESSIPSLLKELQLAQNLPAIRTPELTRLEKMMEDLEDNKFRDAAIEMAMAPDVPLPSAGAIPAEQLDYKQIAKNSRKFFIQVEEKPLKPISELNKPKEALTEEEELEKFLPGFSMSYTEMRKKF